MYSSTKHWILLWYDQLREIKRSILDKNLNSKSLGGLSLVSSCPPTLLLMHKFLLFSILISSFKWDLGLNENFENLTRIYLHCIFFFVFFLFSFSFLFAFFCLVCFCFLFPIKMTFWSCHFLVHSLICRKDDNQSQICIFSIIWWNARWNTRIYHFDGATL